MTSLQHLTSIISLRNNGKLENFGKIQTFLGLKRQKIVRMHKTCFTSQFLRHSLARFSREMACLPSVCGRNWFQRNKQIFSSSFRFLQVDFANSMVGGGVIGKVSLTFEKCLL